MYFIVLVYATVFTADDYIVPGLTPATAV
jgi:hypothetical protein